VLVVHDHGAIVGIVTEAMLADALAVIVCANDPRRGTHLRTLQPPTRPSRRRAPATRASTAALVSSATDDSTHPVPWVRQPGAVRP
jgi:hypothetical protein